MDRPGRCRSRGRPYLAIEARANVDRAELWDLNAALDALEREDKSLVKLIEMRYFGTPEGPDLRITPPTSSCALHRITRPQIGPKNWEPLSRRRCSEISHIERQRERIRNRCQSIPAMHRCAN